MVWPKNRHGPGQGGKQGSERRRQVATAIAIVGLAVQAQVLAGGVEFARRAQRIPDQRRQGIGEILAAKDLASGRGEVGRDVRHDDRNAIDYRELEAAITRIAVENAGIYVARRILLQHTIQSQNGRPVREPAARADRAQRGEVPATHVRLSRRSVRWGTRAA